MGVRMIRVFILFGVAMATAYVPDGFKGRAKSFKLTPNAEDTMRNYSPKGGNPADDGFPNELRYVLTLEGNTETELHLVRERTMRIPESFKQDPTGQFTRKNITNPQEVVFYKDLYGKGTFACQRQISSLGQFKCELSAMLTIGEETCFIGLGASHADCASKDQELSFYFPESEVDKKRHTVVKTGSPRTKRNILPAQGFKTVKVAYLPDAKFTDLFYRRHPGDIPTAETEMMMFFTLLTNEINVYYSTFVEISSGNMNIQLYPSAVALPGHRQNFYWSENFNDGTNLHITDDARNNLEYIVNDSEFISGQFDYVFAITGFNLKDASNGDPLVSFTFIKTICTTSRLKYALTEFTSWNLPRILAHELGHALGALHDDDTSCPSGVNIMSQFLFSPNETTKDTYYFFSTCSVADIIAHLNSQSPCLVDDFTYAEFVDSFCQGFLGEQVSSVDKQCERLTNYVGSAACDTVTEEACYSRNQITCSDSGGSCTQKLKYLWNFTPCGTDKVCYKGSCLATFDICSTTSSTTTTSTTTPTSTSSTSTTTPTTTTTTSTSSTSTTTTSTSTTTPTTTTSTSTTSTTTPTTTTTSTTTPTTTTSTTTSTSTTTPTTTSTSTSTTTPTTTTSTTTTPTTTTSSTTSTTTPTTTTSTSTTTPTTTSTTSTTSTTTPTTTTSTTTTPTTTTSSTTSTTTPTTTTSTSTTTPTTTTSTTSTTTPTTTTSTTTTPTTTTSSTTSTTTPTTTTPTTTSTITPTTTTTISTTTPTTASTTTPTTTTSPTTTSTITTPSTTTSNTTSSTISSTTSSTTTTTTQSSVPCSCCGFKRNKRRKRCCKTALKKIDAVCYCCGSLKKVEEPDGWTGRRF